MHAQLFRSLSQKTFRQICPGAVIFLVLAGSLAAQTPVTYPSDWSDLERRPIYGSEKEQKLRINALVVEEEHWDGHYALNAFGLFRYTDYPAFSRLSIYPFYSGLESKTDGRSSGWVFPFFYTFTEHGGASVLLTPLSLHTREDLPTAGGERGGFDLIAYLYVDSRSGSVEPGGGERSRALLPILFHSRDERRNLTSLAVAPLFYGRSIDNENEDAFRLISVLGYFDETSTRSGDTTLDSSFHAGPLYFYSADRRTYDGNESYRSSFWSPLMPLYFSNREESGEIQRLVGNVYYETTESGELDLLVIPPLYAYVQDEDRGATHMSPLFYYSSTGNERTVSVPILPVYYASDDAAGSTRLYANVHIRRDAGGAVDTWNVYPFFFYASADEAERNAGDTGVLAVVPFYHRLRVRDHAGIDTTYTFGVPYFAQASNGTRYESSSIYTPLGFYDARDDRRGETRSQHVAHASPLHAYSYRETQSGVTSAFRAPFVPIYYASDSTETGSTRVYGPVFTQQDPEDELRRLGVLPFFYYSAGADGMLAIVPFYFHTRHRDAAGTDRSYTFGAPYLWTTRHNERGESQSFYSPLAYYSDAATASPSGRTTQSENHISPFYYYSDRVERDGTDVEYATSFWAPLIPLYYARDSSRDGSARLYGNVSTARNPNGELERFVAFPLFFYYPNGAGGNTAVYAPPFYFQSTHKETESGGEHLSFSPLHYARTTHGGTAQESSTLWAGPYYRSYDRAADTHTSLLAPLYYSWDYPESEFTLALPAYFSYDDGQRYLHVNASGLSISRNRGMLPTLGRNETNEWYVDQDIALFYSLFRFSTRIVLTGDDAPKDTEPNANFAEFDLNGTKQPNVADDEPERRRAKDRLADADERRRDVSRENARTFWGIQSFFGLVAYEQADTRRHFRMLPLSWLTWDEASENRTLVVPGMFLSYLNESEDTEYFALFPGFIPLYGRQRDGKSFTEAYLALGYLREYDAEEQRSEHSVLWPIANYHSSPDRRGGRILPLVWHSAERDPHAEDPDNAWSSLTIAPMFYLHQTPDETSQALVPLYHTYEQTRYDNSREFRWLSLPGFYYRAREHDGAGGGTAFEETESWLLPLFYDYRYDSQGQQTAHRQVSPLHYISSNKTENYVSFAWAGYIYEHNAAADSFEHTALWPLANFHSSPQSYGGRMLPFFWYRADRVDGYRNAASGDTGANANVATAERWSSTTITPLFYRSQDTAANSDTMLLPAPGIYAHSSPDQSTYSWLGLAQLDYDVPYTEDAAQDEPAAQELSAAHLAPILFYERNDHFHVAPLYFGFFGGGNATHFGPGYYHSSDAVGTHTNLLLLADLSTDHKRGLERLWLMPVFAHRGYHEDMARGDSAYTYVAPIYYGHDPGEETTSLHLLPIAYSWYTPASTGDVAGRPAEFTLFAGGLYVRRAGDESRDNFLYLVDRDVRGAYADYGLLLNSLSLETGPDKLHMNAGYGLLAGVRSEEERFSANILWASHEHDTDTLHNSFFPLWWYEHESTARSTTWFLAPLLSGGKHTPNESYQLIGGGALYHEFSDTYADEYSQRILLGAVYENVRRPERGFSARGSLWRYLWEYEYETETDYEKFSVLKFVYSRTHHNGRTNYRILGVRVSES